MILLGVIGLFTSSVFAETSMNKIAEQYVKLVLALGEHDSDYVDAYYGPQEWRTSVKSSNKDLKSIVAVADNLIKELKGTELQLKGEMNELRFSYLQVQLSALKARAKMLAGDISLDFDAQSRALYDTEAPHFELSEFDQVLEKLDQLLPGEEPLNTKVEKFKQQFIIPKNKLSEIFNIAIKECRDRTTQHIRLLKKENFKLEYVKDKPWSGYNWYKGDAFSLIQMNIELPIDISRAIDLGCHEGYPGHHTYNALLEENLVKKRGWIEFTVYPLFSPQSLIAEGSANYGIEMAFPGDEKFEFEKQKLFPIAGIDQSLADKYKKFSTFSRKLTYASNELARSYLNGDIDDIKAVEMLQKYTLASKKKAQQRVRFWNTYGAYVINYNWGKDMVKKWVESGKDQSPKGRWKRFSKLLSSPRLPSTLN